MKTALPLGLPRRLLVIGPNWFIKTTDAIERIRMNKAREVFSNDGKLLGIELGHFGPAPAPNSLLVPSLPPSELRKIIYLAPSRTQQRTCRLMVRITRAFWRAQYDA